MGSPEDEPGRFENETPHEVTIASGFWMFDSPCTQRLWSALMDGNPSYFPDPDRPVEQVDWNQATEFATRLTERLRSPRNEPFQRLEFRLPTEAQWEYACRAGSETPFSFGNTITTDQVNYDGNYPYSGSRKGEYREQTVENRRTK